MIRSPSVHRHYGEAGPHSPRPPISASRTPVAVAVGEDDDDEKPHISTAIASLHSDNNEKPDLTLQIPRASLAVPSNTTSTTASRIRASSAVENYASSIAPSPTHVIRRSSSVPEIRVEIPTIVPRLSSQVVPVQSPETRHHDTSPSSILRRFRRTLHPLIENFRIRGIGRRDSHREEVGLEAGGVEDEIHGISDGEGEGRPSNNTSDDDIPHRTFEAFPTLNQKRWFDSTKTAMVFCGLTSVLICIDVVYNIVLAARGGG
jgi:hypothetical protein